MNRFVILLLASAFLFFGCGKNKKEPFAPAEEKSGKIVVNVTWPDSAYTSKSANLSSSDVDIITAYVYSVQREITHANLIHDGNQGIAEIIVPAGVNYRFDLVAYESWFDQVLYIGYEDSINVIADDTAYVNITMVDIYF